ncbi:MAG: protein tyrosine phosphatase, partial [Pseudomonadota bacterium]
MLGEVKAAWRRWDADWRGDWTADLDAPGARARAAFDMTVFDHGFLRWIWTNEAEFAPGLWRANQPDPTRLRRLAARGFRTVLNVRGVS